MSDETPTCDSCLESLDRVDHYAIEHTILDDGVYRPVSISDPGVRSDEYPLASAIDLWCGRCNHPLTVEQRAWFYQRWLAMHQYMDLHGLISGEAIEDAE